ncbi:hypothetical protein DQM11_08120 [Leuconostoc pseudomesenteroides]|nr:hypothetical protein DQM11_08120 [Leuconostoc pseudomesenteroides]
MIEPIDALHFGRPDVEDERWRYKQDLLDKLHSERDDWYTKRDDLENQMLEVDNEISELDATINKIKNGD